MKSCGALFGSVIPPKHIPGGGARTHSWGIATGGHGNRRTQCLYDHVCDSSFAVPTYVPRGLAMRFAVIPLITGSCLWLSLSSAQRK